MYSFGQYSNNYGGLGQANPSSFIPHANPIVNSFQSSNYLRNRNFAPVKWQHPNIYWNQFGPLASNELLKFSKAEPLTQPCNCQKKCCSSKLNLTLAGLESYPLTSVSLLISAGVLGLLLFKKFKHK